MNTQIIKQGDIEIHVHRALCIGAATCVVYAPSTFDLDSDNLAFIQNKQWDRLEKIVAAAQSCPVVAIEVYQNGRRLYPKQKKK